MCLIEIVCLFLPPLMVFYFKIFTHLLFISILVRFDFICDEVTQWLLLTCILLSRLLERETWDFMFNKCSMYQPCKGDIYPPCPLKVLNRSPHHFQLILLQRVTYRRTQCTFQSLLFWGIWQSVLEHYLMWHYQFCAENFPFQYAVGINSQLPFMSSRRKAIYLQIKLHDWNGQPFHHFLSKATITFVFFDTINGRINQIIPQNTIVYVKIPIDKITWLTTNIHLELQHEFLTFS